MLIGIAFLTALSAVGVAAHDDPSGHSQLAPPTSGAEGSAAHNGNSSWPFPKSQGDDNFKSFMKNCGNMFTANATTIACPSTYFSKMPDEWLNAKNPVVAASAKKYSNFSILSDEDIKGFYKDLCPVLREGNSSLPFPQSEGEEKFKSFVKNCGDFETRTTTTLACPSVYFSKMPDEWASSTNTTIAASAKKYANFSALTDEDIKGFYHDLCPPRVSAEGLAAHHGNNSSWPFPKSQGDDNFKSFMKNCGNLFTANATTIACPSTYFSKMPDEWLNAKNPVVAASAKKYSNFSILSDEDIKGFYKDLCPTLREGNASLPFPQSEGEEKFKTFVKNCGDFETRTTTTLACPSVYFSKMPDEWVSSTNTTIAASAKKYANFSALTDEDIKGFYHDLCPPGQSRLRDPATHQHTEEAKAIMEQVAAVCHNVQANNLTGLPAPNVFFTKSSYFDKILNVDHNSKEKGQLLIRIAKSLFNRLLTQTWTDSETTAFWQALCSDGSQTIGAPSPSTPPSGRQNGTNANETASPTAKPNLASRAQSVAASWSLVAMSVVLLGFL